MTDTKGQCGYVQGRVCAQKATGLLGCCQQKKYIITCGFVSLQAPREVLELEITQAHLAQKPILRVDVHVRALRASQTQ